MTHTLYPARPSLTKSKALKASCLFLCVCNLFFFWWDHPLWAAAAWLMWLLLSGTVITAMHHMVMSSVGCHSLGVPTWCYEGRLPTSLETVHMTLKAHFKWFQPHWRLKGSFHPNHQKHTFLLTSSNLYLKPPKGRCSWCSKRKYIHPFTSTVESGNLFLCDHQKGKFKFAGWATRSYRELLLVLMGRSLICGAASVL